MSTPAPAPVKSPPAPANPAPAPKPEIALDFITKGAFTLTEELADVTAPVRQRNDRQVAMDTLVKEIHEVWLKAGKPGTWPELVRGKCVKTFFVEPDKAPDLHDLINNSAKFHGYAVRYGTAFKATEKLIREYGLPDIYIGREVVSFAVRDRRARVVKTDETSKATGTAKK